MIAKMCDGPDIMRAGASSGTLQAETHRDTKVRCESYVDLDELVESSQQNGEGPNEFEGIVGASLTLRGVLDQVRVVAPTGSTVLIEGETGTGKELLATAIHICSQRRNRPFVKVNCAAIPLGLLESELFGHEKGAFTGAVTQKLGRFESADGGTLFLDEIGDIPLELQAKLLRVLQEQEFERLGSTYTRRINVRMVAATNQDLARLVEAKQFRMDLFYRLNVFPITLPPLRCRTQDIPLLIAHFVRKYSQSMSKRIAKIPKAALDSLIRYEWPGNIRELQNFIERSVILTRGAELKAPVEELSKNEVFADNARTLADAGRDHIINTLRKTNWVVGGKCGAASRLGLNRTTLIAKMRKLGISRETIEQVAGSDKSSIGALAYEFDSPAIRELQNVIERAMILSKSPVFNVALRELERVATPRTLQPDAKTTQPEQENLDDLLDETERTQIVRALEASYGVIGGPSGAATRLGIKRSTLQLRMQRLGIRLSPSSRTALTESKRTAG
jgi:transcriptional regulator with GAF, ATPase, and Fis domain